MLGTNLQKALFYTPHVDFRQQGGTESFSAVEGDLSDWNCLLQALIP